MHRLDPPMATSLLLSQSPGANPSPKPSKRLKIEEEKMIEEGGGVDPSASEERNWAELQVDVLLAIFQKIPMRELLKSTGPVCSSWWKVTKGEPVLWKRIDVIIDGIRTVAMVKLAVDWSRGRLEEFWVGGRHCTDDLLQYVADRASNLKSLRLISCVGLSEMAVKEAVKKLKMLEEVELTHCRLPTEVLETIGQECPLLQRFKLKQSFDSRFNKEVGDDPALSVGAFMPQICYLQFFGSRMANEGLKTILRQCCNLEMLDIRACWNVQMNAEMQALSSKLRNLVLPNHILDVENEFASEMAAQTYLNVSDDEDEDEEEDEDDDVEYYHEVYYYDDYGEYDDFNDLYRLYAGNFMKHYSGIVPPGPSVHYSRAATLRPESRGWALKLRLFYKSGQFLSMDRAKTYQRLIFIDEDGFKIQSTLFNRDIVDVGNRFTTNHVYHISNAEIAPVEQHFRVVDHQYQLKLSRRASVYELEQEHFKVKDDNYNFMPLCNIMNFGDTVDILVVVINVGPVKEIRKQCGETSLVRNVTVIDNSLRPTLLSLWGNFALDEGEILSRNLLHDIPIIAALFVTVNSFAGTSFSTKSKTVILIDPDTAKAKELRQWVDNNRSDVEAQMCLPSSSRERGESSSSASQGTPESSSSSCRELKNTS